ncbi:MAG: hypothetical protein ACYC0X_20065 [Pirellulaceae bacterium]
MGKPLLVHVVRYCSPALLHHVESAEKTVAATIKLDEGSWRPGNVGIARSDALRLLHDLRPILAVAPLLFLLVAVGCSAHVDVNTKRFTPPTLADKSSTVFAVDAAIDPRSTPAAPPINPPAISDNTFILNIRGGDTYYRSETHVHLHDPSPPRVEERVTVQREVQAESPRRVDERCERMAREHEERVKRWRKFPGRY